MSDTTSREQLTERRTVLEERLAAIRTDLGRGLDRDSGERAVELENAEVLAEIARVAESELEQIDRQLADVTESEATGR